MLSLKAASALVVLAAVLVSAQTPPQRGALLLQPGLSAAKCVTASSDTDGAAVTLQTCTGATSQQWTFSEGTVRIFGNKCLDVPGGNTKDGTHMQIWTCSENANQKMFYTYDNRLTWINHGKCLDLTSGSLADDNPIQMWSCGSGDINQVWNAGYLATALPDKSEDGQVGTNNCGTTSSQTSMCQTAWINDATDFCLWAPPKPNNGTIGDTERVEVAWCTKSGRGTRTIPNGVLNGVHFVQTKDYVQVTGSGDFTKINVPKGDAGGELDPHGADGNGNPIGGLVYGNTFGTNLQYHEWTSFISDAQFCFRACTGPNAAENCQHIYDLMGCFWVSANYDSGVFENCLADNDLPMGVYGTSTWHQGISPTPEPHPVAKSSSCTSLPTVSVSPAIKKRNLQKRHAPASPVHS
ncbi:carbohydrate-binding module family 13 protein [Hysterangium stoloniferum]|nr:carbohydrate-binding module family 13 protein [Hysterangium stoloniferum]